MSPRRDAERSEERQALRARTVAQFSRKAGTYQQRYEMLPSGAPASAFAYARGFLDDALAGILAGLPAGARVLDAGCGTGHYLRQIRDRGYDIVGVEPAAPMRLAARHLNPETPILGAVISELPFQDRQFDLVVAIGVLRYLHPGDVRAALAEMLRVTRPGRKVFLTVVNRFALNTFYMYYAVRRVLNRYAGIALPMHCEFTTPREVRQELLGLGADDVVVLPWVVIPVVRPMYRLHPAAGRFMAKIMQPLERALSAHRWAANIAGGLIVVARRREDPA